MTGAEHEAIAALIARVEADEIVSPEETQLLRACKALMAELSDSEAQLGATRRVLLADVNERDRRTAALEAEIAKLNASELAVVKAELHKDAAEKERDELRRSLYMAECEIGRLQTGQLIDAIAWLRFMGWEQAAVGLERGEHVGAAK